jgi:type I restriction enzyme R subunit
MSYSESDTLAKLITPALYARGWTEDHLRREENAGGIDIIAGKARRSRKRVDVTLRVKAGGAGQPVAVALIEAKAEHLPPTHGLEQGKLYADSKRLNVPFVYTTNGHLFVEYDRSTGMTSAPQPMVHFPSPEALRQRYETLMQIALSSHDAQPLLTPYTQGEGGRRYYQDAAIRATLEKLARGEKRALLTLATGAGKTFIAVNLLRRIADAGQLRRALFVCDRDELRTQALSAFQNVFGADAAAVSKGNPQLNARVLVATYQTLDVDSADGTGNFFTTHYPPDTFSHIIIDECHRSAWGKWSMVLTNNPNAVQIGLTATPRQLKLSDEAANSDEARTDLAITADNIRHFGEPVYEYDMSQGFDDGYLARCEVLQREINLDQTGVTRDEVLRLGPRDPLTGELLSGAEVDELYEKTSFEQRLLLPDRVLAMCKMLFADLLASGGPEQKTIIFCARDQHADAVAITMNNLYAAWCRAIGRERKEPYAFKCTAASGGGEYVADLRGSNHSHFIATTVDLLTTGVDVPPVENIVFFRYLKSPITFYQMVGRGTRINAPTGKLMFRVHDYTNASRLFGEDFITSAALSPLPPGEMAEGDGAMEREPARLVQVEGFSVQITEAGRFILTGLDGRATPVTVEEYRDQLAAALVARAASLDVFRERWIVPDERRALLEALPDGEGSARLIRSLAEMDEYDLYDVLAEAGYGLLPRTRQERAEAFAYKQAEWLKALPPKAAETVQAMAAQFAGAGTEALENPQMFQVPAVKRAGGMAALVALGSPAEMVLEVKRRVFAA